MKLLAAKIQNAIACRFAGGDKEFERGDHLLEVLGTIIIAVVILILFKDAIVNIFTSALNNTTNSVGNLFSNATSVNPG